MALSTFASRAGASQTIGLVLLEIVSSGTSVGIGLIVLGVPIVLGAWLAVRTPHEPDDMVTPGSLA